MPLVESPLALVEAGSKPSAPPAGEVLFYAKTDGHLYVQTPDGTETQLGGGGSAATPTAIAAGATYALATNTQTLFKRRIVLGAGARIVGAAGAVLMGTL